MLIISSFLDALSISMLLPVLQLLIDNTNDNFVTSSIKLMFPTYKSVAILNVCLLLFLLVITLKNIFIIAKNRMHLKLTFGLRELWMAGITKNYLNLQYAKIAQSKSDNFVGNIIVEAEKAQFCIKFIIQFISSLILSISMFCVLLITSFKVTMIISPIAIIIGIVINRFTNEYSREVGKKKIKYARRILNSSNKILKSIRYIKIFGLEGKMYKKNGNLIRSYTTTLSDFRFFSMLPKNIGEFIAFLGLIIAILYAINYTDVPLANLVPTLSVFIVVTNRIVLQITTLINSSMGVLSNIASLRLVHKILTNTEDQEDIEIGSIHKKNNSDILLKNFSVYDDNNLVSFTANIHIPNNKFVVLQCDNTDVSNQIVDILLRFNAVGSGEFTNGDREVEDFNIKSWRKNICYVGNEYPIFYDTIRDIITNGDQNIPEDDIRLVCEISGLSEFIENKKNGLDTIVDRDNETLNITMRQQLGIAQSILKDSQLVIYDYAMQYLDNDLENSIMSNLKRASRPRTIFYISNNERANVYADVLFKTSINGIERIDL